MIEADTIRRGLNGRIQVAYLKYRVSPDGKNCEFKLTKCLSRLNQSFC